MPDSSKKRTEAEMAAIERELTAIYGEAYESIKQTAQDYFEKFEKRNADMKAKLANGEITKTYYREWYRNQVGRGDRWVALRDKLAGRLTNINEVAAAYVNDRTPSIYTLNANYMAYTIESVGGNVDFTILHDEAVRNVVVNGNNQSEFKVSDGQGGYTFRRLQVDPKVDYAWNSQQIERHLTAGILAGDSPKQMADRFMGVMQNNYNAAVRNARTAVTSAQNAGTQRTMEAAHEQGIELLKVWMATTSDNRTRDSHLELDGIRIPVDDVFPNGLKYPCDPDGEPGEVYNCRCSMGYILPGINENIHNTGKTIESYEEWLASKQKGGDGGDVD